MTLSPALPFRSWLFRALGDGQIAYLSEAERALLHKIREQGWSDDEAEQDALRPAVLAAAAHYYLLAKDRAGLPLDPVARFHLGNGARLERLNWLGDTSEKGVRQGLSLMVNYRYDLRDIERNHEAYVNQGYCRCYPNPSGRCLIARKRSRALVPSGMRREDPERPLRLIQSLLPSHPCGCGSKRCKHAEACLPGEGQDEGVFCEPFNRIREVYNEMARPPRER